MKVLEIFYPVNLAPAMRAVKSELSTLFFPINAEKIKHVFNCLFRDKVVAVGAPCGYARNGEDVRNWTVEVDYKYKGRKVFNFPSDDERYITTYGSARQAAQDTYALYHRAMEKQRAKQK